MPAGTTKIVKGAKVVKGLDKASDARKGLKNADAISEGRKFEIDELKKAIDRGENVSSQTRLVPKNGKGNVKGNRTNTDQLIKNEDGTFTIVETKRSRQLACPRAQEKLKNMLKKAMAFLRFDMNAQSKDYT